MLQRVSTQKSSPIGRIGAELELSETLNSQIFKLLNFQNFFKLSSIPRRHLQISKYLSNITKDFSIFILRWPPSGLVLLDPSNSLQLQIWFQSHKMSKFLILLALTLMMASLAYECDAVLLFYFYHRPQKVCIPTYS